MRPAFRALVLCCLVMVAAGYYLNEYRRGQERFRAWRQDQIFQAALAHPVRIILPDPEHATLQEALEQLREQVDVPIDFVSDLGEKRLYPRHLLSRDGSVQGIYQGPLDDVLDQIFHSAEGDEPSFQLLEGRIVVQLWPEYPPGEITKSYQIPAAAPGRVPLNESRIVELITTTIEPESWEDVGGPYVLTSSPGGVTVVASTQIHRKIGQMLELLAALPAEPASPEPVAFLDAGSSEDSAKVLAALDRVSDFDYEDEPLQSFLAKISRRYDFPVAIAAKSLSEAAISLENPVNLKMSGVSLRTFLRTALGELELTYILRPEGMVITTPEDAGNQLTLLLYPLQGLYEPGSEESASQLADVITTAVDPDSWEDVGGAGSLDLLGGGWLLISQSQETHERLLRFLHQLRREIPHLGLQAAPFTRQEQGTSRLRSFLSGPEIRDLETLSLEKFAGALTQRLGAPVVLARRELDEASIAPDSVEICLTAQSGALWRQLEEALEPYGMSFDLRDGSLVLTTHEDAASRLQTETFDLRELSTLGKGIATEELLIALIQHSIGEDYWEDVGGAGSICSFRDFLMIQQDSHSLFAIREFLTWLRAHRGELPTLADVAELRRDGYEYRRLISLSKSSPDHWLAVYLQVLLNPELRVSWPVDWQVPVSSGRGGGYSGCVF